MAKIIVNLDLRDLEQMLGKDSEAMIEVASSVVQQFAERHLKAIANDVIVEKAAKAAKAYTESEFTKLVGKLTQRGWDYGFTPSDALNKALQNQARTAVAKATEGFIAAAVEERMEQIQSIIDQRTSHLTLAAIDEAVKRRLTRAAKS